MNMVILLGLGLLVGALSGLLGVGGGVLLIPALKYFYQYNQYQAQGTTLAMMVPPIGILAAYQYYQKGYVDLKIALFLALGFLAGGFFGSKLALYLPIKMVQKLFALFLIGLGIKMLWID